MPETWMLFIFGVLLSIIGFLIVYVLNGIKADIRDIKDQLPEVETALHGRITDVERRHDDRYVDIDRRLSKVEARCDVQHVSQ